MLELTKEELINQVNNTLRYFMWGGYVVDMHKNDWGEWIADCIVYNPDYRDNVAISKPKPREWQYMIDIVELSIGFSVQLYKAHNDKREMTFIESLGFYDKDAPRSPYIDELVEKEYDGTNISF